MDAVTQGRSPQASREQLAYTIPCRRAQDHHHPSDSLPHPLWRLADTVPNRPPPEIAVVAPEQFVSSIARKRDCHMLACKPGHQMGRDLRGITEWLIVHFR